MWVMVMSTAEVALSSKGVIGEHWGSLLSGGCGIAFTSLPSWPKLFLLSLFFGMVGGRGGYHYALLDLEFII